MNDNDELIEVFLKRHQSQFRSVGLLEKIGSGSEYFSLEKTTGKDGKASYAILRVHPNEDDQSTKINASDLAKCLRKEIPFIPALLRISGKGGWAHRADAIFELKPDTGFLYDALLLDHADLFVQLDWKYASVPDGFKFSVEFNGEKMSTYYPLHSDMVATAVERGEPVLKVALQVCPDITKKLFLLEPDLLAAYEKSVLEKEIMPAPVSGHKLSL